ncbi:oligomeric, coiled-coil, peripheral membrane protein [Phlyctochytrium bullatum]|nr:oligomeric, coiled-coil, peripheral membrane protein [Phlyctochytrium bullatum]
MDLSRLDDLRKDIESLTGVPVGAQIILTDKGAPCKPDLVAKEFAAGKGAPAAEAEGASAAAQELALFVFNRQLLDPRTSSSSDLLNTVDIEPPVPAEVLQILAFEVGSLLPNRAQTYIASFRSHVLYSTAVAATARNHLKGFEKVLEEQRVQISSLRIALTNLEGHSKSVCNGFDKFHSHAQRELSKHSNLLQSFPSDLQALHRIPIHLEIAKDHKLLSDYVPEEKLLTWVDSCRVAHEQIVRKVNGLSDTIKGIKTGTDAEVSQLLSVDFDRFEATLNVVRDRVGRIENGRQLCERDLSRVDSALRDIESNPQAGDRLQAIDHLYQIHRTEYLPDLAKHDAEIRHFLTELLHSKKTLYHTLISRLQTISNLQSSIATVTPLLSTLTTTLASHSQAFGQLLHVHRMPPAWGATLVEIVRRKEYVKIFLGRAREMAEVLAKYRGQEEKRRETFRNEISRYLPAGLVTGLDDKPPYCEITVSNTKDTLPNITKDDIADFEQLVANLRVAMKEVGGSTSVASGTTPPSSATGVPLDSISKLQATMMKMSSQVSGMSVEFDRILLKSGLCAKMEEEAAKLRQENSQLRNNSLVASVGSPTGRNYPHGLRSVSAGSLQAADVEGSRAEEKIRAYESRIRNLEKLLQDSYNINVSKYSNKCDIEALKATIDALRNENDMLQSRVSTFDSQIRLGEGPYDRHQAESEKDSSNEELRLIKERYAMLEKEHSTLKTSFDALSKEKHLFLSELDRLSTFMKEVNVLVESCSKALVVDEDRQQAQAVFGMSEPFPVGIPSSIRHVAKTSPAQADVASPTSPSSRTSSSGLPSIPVLAALRSDEKEIRKRMRELEDDIRCQSLELKALQEVSAWRMQQSTKSSEGIYTDGDGPSSRVMGHTSLSPNTLRGEHVYEDQTTMPLESVVAIAANPVELQMSSSVAERLPGRDKELAMQVVQLLNENEKLLKANQGLKRLRESTKSSNVSSSASEHLPQYWHDLIQSAFKQLRSRNLSLKKIDAALEPLKTLAAPEENILVPLPESVSAAFDSVVTSSARLNAALGSKPGEEDVPESLQEGWCTQSDLGDPVALANWVEAPVNAELQPRPKTITFQRFQENDLALFLPTRNPKAWAAFNVNSPHFFLSTESTKRFETQIKNRDWILANIMSIDERIAVRGDPATNPYGLADGTKYYWCEVEPWEGMALVALGKRSSAKSSATRRQEQQAELKEGEIRVEDASIQQS